MHIQLCNQDRVGGRVIHPKQFIPAHLRFTYHGTYKKTPDTLGSGVKNGASEEVRTLDIYLGKVGLYQLSYARLYKI